ncbi:MAG: GAF domain-containing protein [Bacteroidetes bacterium]|nr:GAF domain-containing protein [Bacteroidota bacterium]
MPWKQSSAITEAEKVTTYQTVAGRVDALLEDESDWVAAMATVVCELHQAFEYYDWTGFYRTIGEELVIGPYQGTHGCLRIAFGRGVCGTAAAQRATQVVPDVDAFPGHIACSSTTRSEIVVPVLSRDGDVMGVLDIDSNRPAAFDTVDQQFLERLCTDLGRRYG